MRDASDFSSILSTHLITGDNMIIFMTTFERILVLFFFILAGFSLIKLKVLPKNSAEVLSKLENNLFIPALVFSTFASDFTVSKISSAWKLFLLSSVICALTILFARICVRFISRDQFTRNIYTYGLVFSNFGFMGNVIVSAVFPEIFLEYLIFTLPLWTMIYVWGVPCLLIPRGEGNIRNRLLFFVNPMFVCMLLGMIIGLFNIKLPEFISVSVDTLGSCMSPISMILTGVIVAGINIRKVIKDPSIYVVCAIRLLLLPLLGLIIFSFIKVPSVYVVCTVCALSMPLGLNIMVIPSGYGKDTSLAAASIIISHLISGITIPLIFMIMMQMV